ncbi:MAG: potassium-transporting ATPase subunit KdpC [Gammaproteobacteria bacterium]
MYAHFKTGLILFILMAVLTGGIYPMTVTGLAQWLFPEQANGSLIKNNQGKIVGSSLIGQAFTDPRYFWGRPSATQPYPYHGGASGGSNLGPSNPLLHELVKKRLQTLKALDPHNKEEPVPVDLITASASGLDPDISPAAAEYQISRIAKARGIKSERLRALIAAHTEPRQWGFLGEPRVNVLQLNRAIDGSED